MPVIRGVGYPGFTFRDFCRRCFGEAAGLRESSPGRPGRRAAWWRRRRRRRRAGEKRGHGGSASGARRLGVCVCGVTRLGSGWGGPRGRCLCLGRLRRGEEHGGRVLLQRQPGPWKLLTRALRCSRSWLPIAALTDYLSSAGDRAGTRVPSRWAASGCCLPASGALQKPRSWGGALGGVVRLRVRGVRGGGGGGGVGRRGGGGGCGG